MRTRVTEVLDNARQCTEGDEVDRVVHALVFLGALPIECTCGPRRSTGKTGRCMQKLLCGVYYCAPCTLCVRCSAAFLLLCPAPESG